MHQDEELHAQLMQAFREYFAENQVWMDEATKASSIRLRHKLSEIRRICSARRVAILDWQVEKRRQLRERADHRLAQKGKGQGSADTN